MSLQVVLIRHGETDYNAEKRLQGNMQIPLNDLGRQQAHALAAYLVAWPIARLYASDLSRAWETACIVGGALGVKPQPDERWREINAGRFEGNTWAEIEQQFPDEIAQYRQLGEDFQMPDGESWNQVGARAYAALHDLSNSPEGMVGVVTHGGTLRRVLMRVFPDQPEMRHVRFDNTSLTVLDFNPGNSWRVLELNITPHLK